MLSDWKAVAFDPQFCPACGGTSTHILDAHVDVGSESPRVDILLVCDADECTGVINVTYETKNGVTEITQSTAQMSDWRDEDR